MLTFGCIFNKTRAMTRAAACVGTQLVIFLCVCGKASANLDAAIDDDVPEVCDKTKYNEWMKLQGSEIEKYSRDCRYALNQLRLDQAGWWGPVAEEDIYDVMCSNACLKMDQMHVEAMEESYCNCRELSTRTSNLEADFCSANSARMLCHQYQPLMSVVTGTDLLKGERINRIMQRSSKGSLERCGQWNCPLEDYMCPRYEWNRKWVCGSGVKHFTNITVLLFSLLSATMLFYTAL